MGPTNWQTAKKEAPLSLRARFGTYTLDVYVLSIRGTMYNMQNAHVWDSCDTTHTTASGYTENATHGSDSADTAARESNLIFGDKGFAAGASK